jgi:hypothetical protein
MSAWPFLHRAVLYAATFVGAGADATDALIERAYVVYLASREPQQKEPTA